MHYARTAGHILAVTLICLALVGLAAAYWALAGSDSLLLRDDNPRIIEAQRNILRGGIYDRQTRPLAETVRHDAGLTRRYPLPSAYSIAGYFSLRYGVGGAEAAYDALLSGDEPIESLNDFFQREILNRPQVGSDIRLTLDLDIQAALVRAMNGAAGTAIVLDARNGAVLALASLPSFDPNTLEADWAELVEATGKPFFNRALQGNYQLGGNMYLIWLAQAIDSGFDLTWRFTGATEPVDLGAGMTAACVMQQDAADLSLNEAFAYGCPAAFINYRQTESALGYEDMLSPYRFDDPFSLAGFPQPEDIAPAAELADPKPRHSGNCGMRSGQGDLTTSPLNLAALIAAIANDGQAHEPRLLSGVRSPGSEQWQAQQPVSRTQRILAIDTAQALQKRCKRPG